MENKTSSNKVAIKWAAFYIVVSIVLTYVYQFLKVDATSGIKYVAYIPFIAFLLLSLKEYKDQFNGGYLTFGEGFVTGLKYTIITSIVMGLFIYIYWTILSPQMYQQVIDKSREQMEAKGNMTSDQIDASMQYLTAGLLTIIATVFSIIGGIIISLIAAAIFKKERPPFTIDESVPYSDPTV